MEAQRCKLHERGWVELPEGIPNWELSRYTERLYRRHGERILRLLEEQHADWMQGDSGDTAPGAHRPGGLAARRVTEQLNGIGIYVYAAHPSQGDDAEEEEKVDDEECTYSGPRWYVSCMEAIMRRYDARRLAPLPPASLQDLLWPSAEDRSRPWLTEVGWTIVPQCSDPQVVHADICSYEDPTPHPRPFGQGRFLHIVWKLDPSERCTTNVVPGGFTEGAASWDDYEKLTQVNAPALIFDSEVLHCGGRTGQVGWSSSLTAQFCSGQGWHALKERVNEDMMKFTYPMGWESGAAIDALVDGTWQPATVCCRNGSGLYSVLLDCGEGICASGLRDSDLRHRQPREGSRCMPLACCTFS